MVDLGAIRRNAARLREAAGPAELWAVVKADGYGHGAVGASRAALAGGATALCVATVREGDQLREAFPSARILVMSPLARGEEPVARDARLEVALTSPEAPEGLAVHLKVDTGMGRWGMSLGEALTVPRERVVGVMSHLATADEADEAFAREQIERFREIAAAFPGVTAHLANSAGALRFPEGALRRRPLRRCALRAVALRRRPRGPRARAGARLAELRRARARARPGESTGYGRRFVAEGPARVGIVPVGYADGFRRGLTGTEVLVDGARRRVVGTVSMDAFAVELEGEQAGAEVTLIGDGILAEDHARVLGTINYELTCGLNREPTRADRSVVDG